MLTPPTPRKQNVFMGSYDKPFVTSKPDAPFISHNDGERLQPKQARDVHVSVLDLNEPSDMKMYTMIWHAAGHNCVKVFNMDSRWMDDVKNWKVLIHWHFDGLMMRDELQSTKLGSVRQLMDASAERYSKLDTLVGTIKAMKGKDAEESKS